MIRLLSSELRRVLARRLVRVLALLALVAVAVAGTLVFLNTRAITDAELAARRRAVAERTRDCVARLRQLPPEATRGLPPEQERLCALARGGTVRDPRFHLRRLEGILRAITAPLVVAGWVIGASAIGADWQSRALTTVLTWEPRRVRLHLAKALACVLVAAVLSVVVQALVAGALLPSALLHGTTAGTGGPWLRSVLGVVGRGTALVAVAAAVGFSMASVGRNTAAALGAGFAYFLIVENVVAGLLADYRQWLLFGNAIVLVSGQDGTGLLAGRSVVVAGVYLGTVAVALVALASAVFARRDVA